MKTQKNTSPSGKRHSCRFILAALAAATSAALPAAVPEISGVTMAQASDRLVTITYTLADASAVVTLDVQTNVTGDVWASIGGEAVWNATGDVWKRVETGSRTITWHPDHSWPDHKIDGNNTRAVVTAWALENTPDYMVVDLTGVPADDVTRYYPGVDFLPKKTFDQEGAAITNNPDYKTTKLVMRKIMARGVEWAMGASTVETLDYNAAMETPHLATLTNNYYIGVFEVTQRQYAYIATNTTPSFFFSVNGDMRPADGYGFDYNRLRTHSAVTAAGTAATSSAIAAYSWPKDPHPSSALGLLRLKTGIDFDLPSHAQWEFACRAGNGFGCWGDGTPVKNASPDTNLAKLARYGSSTSIGNASSTWDETKGTAIVGTYRPNSWGLYDMHGNQLEFCLDYNQGNFSTLKDASGNLLAGRTNIDPDDPTKSLSGATVGNGISGTRIVKGGSWATGAGRCRASFINGKFPQLGTSASGSQDKANAIDVGFRLVCRAGLE